MKTGLFGGQNMEKTKRLGRGLDALLGNGVENAEMAGSQLEVSLERIQQNPFQPRKHYDADEIAALSASMKTHGILQPLVVRSSGDSYLLVAGERRLRAAQDAGLKSVPIRVIDFNDQQAFEATLIENLHRSDLNPIEKAQGFKDYCDRFGLNRDELAQRLGVARSTISNLISLLELPPEVQEGVRLNQISEAHAKLIKGIKNPERQVTVFKQIVAMGLSVKATEAIVRDIRESEIVESGVPAASQPANAESVHKTAHVKGIEDELRKKLTTPVEIKMRAKDKGQIVLRFESNDDFERILDLLRK
jgi:ParB family transcriptional regulator, chromosome partitioning protein